VLRVKALRFIPAWIVGEFVGTFLLVFFGCGSVCAAVTTGDAVGVFQVAIVWGIGIAAAIYLTAALSGAHLNPAVTISLATWGIFPWKRVAGYIAVQLGAAFVSAAFLYVIFGGALAEFEAKKGIVRGEAGSEASAMVFGEFYPNPSGNPLADSALKRMPMWRAFVAEFTGSAVLLLIIFGTTDPSNRDGPQILTAAIIGLTVTLLICLMGPLTMACFNPARDLGPRLFSSLAGWKSVPFTTNGLGWLAVYIIAPILGGLTGGAVYQAFFRDSYRTQHHAIAREEATGGKRRA